MRITLFPFLGAALLLLGCAGDPCVAGSTQACLGPERCEGVQICEADGQRFGACACGGPIADGGARDGGSPARSDGGEDGGRWTDGGRPEVGGELKAFPGAYGGGSSATGGRGGAVIHVTNLQDSGPGSFREAFQTEGPRTIVFDVSGTIDCRTPLSTRYGDFTIAGQTAPEGGITFTGVTPTFEISGRDNMILRYIRIRPTFDVGNDNGDALQIVGGVGVIVDHVSVSWGADEAVDTAGATHGVTFQRSLVAESKTGMIMGNSSASLGGAAVSYDLSALGNLWFQIDHRQPNSVSNGRVDVINNVIWGYGYRLNRPSPGQPSLNEINNYYVSDEARPLHDMHKIDYVAAAGPPQIFSRGNLHLPATVTDPDRPNEDTWTVFGWPDGSFGFRYGGVDYHDDDPPPADFFAASMHAPLGHAWPLVTALEALERVQTDVGANARLDAEGAVLPDVDAVDALYLRHVREGTLLTVDYPFLMAGKPHYEAFLASVSATPLSTHPPGHDTDRDGMPDAWEMAHGFDPSTPDDAGDADGDGYTNLEEYLDLVDL
ncbi:MAG: hypothetical protein EVA89_02285 [Sandaracinaceae bacterium]|nr:MAG: hypothetical protein EVA89_02285 [Sandaracinaceae bacterium]